jgi:RNA-binding protein
MVHIEEIVMPLPKEQKQALIAKAHGLSPVIIIGNQGVTPAVIAEMDRALEHHELIKVKVNAQDKEARLLMIESFTQATESELLRLIGHVAIIYRKRKEK